MDWHDELRCSLMHQRSSVTNVVPASSGLGGIVAAALGFAISPLVRSKMRRSPKVEAAACSSRCCTGSDSGGIVGPDALSAGHLALVRRLAQRGSHLRRVLQQRGDRPVRRRRDLSGGGRRREGEGQIRRLLRITVTALRRGAAAVVLLVVQPRGPEHVAGHLHVLLHPRGAGEEHPRVFRRVAERTVLDEAVPPATHIIIITCLIRSSVDATKWAHHPRYYYWQERRRACVRSCLENSVPQ